MSQDQKPGRMRVVGSGRTPGAAASAKARKMAVVPAADAEESAGAGAADAAAQSGAGGVMLPALLFIGCAAIGGGAVAWLGLAP